jgi:hypothetical protein
LVPAVIIFLSSADDSDQDQSSGPILWDEHVHGQYFGSEVDKPHDLGAIKKSERRQMSDIEIDCQCMAADHLDAIQARLGKVDLAGNLSDEVLQLGGAQIAAQPSIACTEVWLDQQTGHERLARLLGNRQTVNAPGPSTPEDRTCRTTGRGRGAHAIAALRADFMA